MEIEDPSRVLDCTESELPSSASPDIANESPPAIDSVTRNDAPKPKWEPMDSPASTCAKARTLSVSPITSGPATELDDPADENLRTDTLLSHTVSSVTLTLLPRRVKDAEDSPPATTVNPAADDTPPSRVSLLTDSEFPPVILSETDSVESKLTALATCISLKACIAPTTLILPDTVHASFTESDAPVFTSPLREVEP